MQSSMLALAFFARATRRGKEEERKKERKEGYSVISITLVRQLKE
jgi:hypothetical protein